MFHRPRGGQPSRDVCQVIGRGGELPPHRIVHEPVAGRMRPFHPVLALHYPRRSKPLFPGADAPRASRKPHLCATNGQRLCRANDPRSAPARCPVPPPAGPSRCWRQRACRPPCDRHALSMELFPPMRHLRHATCFQYNLTSASGALLPGATQRNGGARVDCPPL